MKGDQLCYQSYSQIFLERIGYALVRALQPDLKAYRRVVRPQIDIRCQETFQSEVLHRQLQITSQPNQYS